jgi:hypothetical protein
LNLSDEWSEEHWAVQSLCIHAAEVELGADDENLEKETTE